jgi:prepilin signal peptidase PulO-like enzyme (type II secretory pathway)
MEFFLIVLFSYLLVFVFGTVLGSFMNVVLYRLHSKEKGIILGRSFCPHCKHPLGVLDLIPLFSFLFLKGKCRYCSKKISWQYPIVESVTGIVFVYLFWSVLLSPVLSPWQIVAYLFYGFILVGISFYDLYHYEIPDVIIIPGIIIAALVSVGTLITPFFAPPFVDALLGVLIALVFLGGQVWISHEKWMGMGDVFIGVFMGIILGWKLTLVALFFAYIIGAVIGVLLMVFQGKKGNSHIPFGPFLSLGTLIALGVGHNILSWYLSFLS